MKSIEMGRKVFRYVGNAASGISGIDAARKIYKEELYTSEDIQLIKKVKKPTLETFYRSSSQGLESVIMPLSTRLWDKNTTLIILGGIGIDIAANVSVLHFVYNGNILAGLITKLGYNTLVQVAPDVARLARNRVFQKDK